MVFRTERNTSHHKVAYQVIVAFAEVVAAAQENDEVDILDTPIGIKIVVPFKFRDTITFGVEANAGRKFTVPDNAVIADVVPD